MKTARFADVVNAAGRPDTYPLWIDPKKDRTFQAALKAHRVMSVHQESVGSKADYGAVGYEGDQRAQVLIFPKSIAKFTGRKIIGVKYDQLEALQEAPAKPKPNKAREKVKTPLSTPPPPEPVVEEMKTSDEPASRETPEANATELLAGIRRAMKQLDAGKAVAAYKTLAKLVNGAGAK